MLVESYQRYQQDQGKANCDGHSKVGVSPSQIIALYDWSVELDMNFKIVAVSYIRQTYTRMG